MNNKLLKKFFGKMLETFPNSNDFRLFLLKYLNYEKLMYEEQNHFEIVDHVLVKVTGSATSVVLPNEIQKIKNDAFVDCDNVQSIYIPNSVKCIEKEAFETCEYAVIYCELPSAPKEWDKDWNPLNLPVYWGINNEVFIEKDGIQYVIKDNKAMVTRCIVNHQMSCLVLPNKIEINNHSYEVKSIEKFAFALNGKLIFNNIIISNNIEAIKENAFLTMYNGYIYDIYFWNVFIPLNVKIVEDYAFGNDFIVHYVGKSAPLGWGKDWHFLLEAPNKLIKWNVKFTIQDGLLFIIKKNKAIIKSYNDTKTSIELPRTIKFENKTYNVHEVMNKAFSFCLNLKEIFIPNTIKKVGKIAFYNSNVILYFEKRTRKNGWIKKLVKYDYTVYLDCNINNFIEIDGLKFLIQNDEATVVKCIKDKEIINIPSTINFFGKTYPVTSIGSLAFSYSIAKKISIPSSIVNIGSAVFWGCEKLQEMFIPNSVRRIGFGAFCCCLSLKELAFEKNSKIETIPFMCFGECKSLEKIAFEQCNLHMIEYFAFCGCESLKSIVLPNGVDTIEIGAFYACVDLQSIVFPANLKKIENFVFNSDNDMVIYSEAERQSKQIPSNMKCLDNHIYWKNEWSYVNGIPTPNK